MLGLQESVMNTMQSAKAPAATTAYQLCWRLFCSWCTGIEVVPESCGVQYVLQYLQARMDETFAASTQRVFGRYICLPCGGGGQANGAPSLGLQVYEGVRRLRPTRTRSMKSWDLDVVLTALEKQPFEPLESASPKHLSMKEVSL